MPFFEPPPSSPLTHWQVALAANNSAEWTAMVDFITVMDIKYDDLSYINGADSHGRVFSTLNAALPIAQRLDHLAVVFFMLVEDHQASFRLLLHLFLFRRALDALHAYPTAHLLLDQSMAERMAHELERYLIYTLLSLRFRHTDFYNQHVDTLAPELDLARLTSESNMVAPFNSFESHRLGWWVLDQLVDKSATKTTFDPPFHFRKRHTEAISSDSAGTTAPGASSSTGPTVLSGNGSKDPPTVYSAFDIFRGFHLPVVDMIDVTDDFYIKAKQAHDSVLQDRQRRNSGPCRPKMKTHPLTPVAEYIADQSKSQGQGQGQSVLRSELGGPNSDQIFSLSVPTSVPRPVPVPVSGCGLGPSSHPPPGMSVHPGMPLPLPPGLSLPTSRPPATPKALEVPFRAYEKSSPFDDSFSTALRPPSPPVEEKSLNQTELPPRQGGPESIADLSDILGCDEFVHGLYTSGLASDALDPNVPSFDPW